MASIIINHHDPDEPAVISTENKSLVFDMKGSNTSVDMSEVYDLINILKDLLELLPQDQKEVLWKKNKNLSKYIKNVSSQIKTIDNLLEL